MSQGAFTPVFFKGDGSISAGQTEVIHSFPVNQFRSLNYILTLYNVLEAKTKTLQISIIKDVDIKWSIFGIVGTGIDSSIDLIENAGNLELTIENKGLFDLECSFGFAPLGEI